MKKYKATVSFVGEICMTVGETREIDDKKAKALVDCGYIVLAESEKKKLEKK